MKKIALTLTMIPCIATAANAAENMTIYTWGYQDLLYNVLWAIRTISGNNGYLALFATAAIIGTLAFILTALMGKGQISLFNLALRFGFALIAWSMISTQGGIFSGNFSVTANANIYDVYNRSTRSIENVPYGFVMPLSIFSRVEYAFNKLFVDALQTSPAGIGVYESVGKYFPASMAASALYATTQYRISDPNISASMNEYMINCVYPDVLTGYFDPYDLHRDKDFWYSIGDTHPSRITKIYKYRTSTNGEVVFCPKAYEHLNEALSGISSRMEKEILTSLGMVSANDTFGQVLSDSSAMLLRTSMSGSRDLMNAISINSYSDSMSAMASINGMNSGSLAYGTGQAQEVSRTQMVISGIQAKKFLPISKGILMCILTASLPLFFVFLIAMQMPSKLLGMFFGMFLAPCFWSLGDALLNFFVLIKADTFIQGWSNDASTWGGISAYTKPIIETQALETINMINNMYWMIPSMAMGFATMSAYALNSAVSSIQSGATAGVGAAAQGVATGTLSVGVTSQNVHRQNLLDMLQKANAGSVFNWANNSQYQNMTTREEGSKSGKYGTELEDFSNVKKYNTSEDRSNVYDGRTVYTVGQLFDDRNRTVRGREYTNTVDSTTGSTATHHSKEDYDLGAVTVNGLKMSSGGHVKRISENTAEVSGIVNGQKMSMILDNAKFEVDEKTGAIKAVSGQTVQANFESGSKHTNQGGWKFDKDTFISGGENLANAIGMLQHARDHNPAEYKQMKSAFLAAWDEAVKLNYSESYIQRNERGGSGKVALDGSLGAGTGQEKGIQANGKVSAGTEGHISRTITTTSQQNELLASNRKLLNDALEGKSPTGSGERIRDAVGQSLIMGAVDFQLTLDDRIYKPEEIKALKGKAGDAIGDFIYSHMPESLQKRI